MPGMLHLYIGNFLGVMGPRRTPKLMFRQASMHSQGSSPPRLKADYYTTCMHGLDDVGWDYGFSLSCYGVNIGARAGSPELVRHMQSRSPFSSKPSKATTVDRLFSVLETAHDDPGLNRYNLYWDHMLIGKHLSFGGMLDMFEALASLAIAELSNEKLFVHAGVVAWQGKAILIPGKSHSGKSTLVAELVKCGATYYSDEFAVIDEKGCVTAYAKPLAIRRPGGHRQTPVPVEKIGGLIGTASLPVGLVVVSYYEMDGRWQPQPLSPGIGLLSLLENTHSAQRTPGRAVQILQNVVRSALVVTSTRGEASVAAPKILSEVPS